MNKHGQEVQNTPIVREAVRRILAASAPDRIIVFGSRARADATHDSDLDLLVVLPHTESRREARIALRIALTGLGVPKDVLVATLDDIRARRHEPGSVLRTALDEGVVVYERAA